MALTRASVARGGEDSTRDHTRSERKAAGPGVSTAQEKREDNSVRAVVFMALLALQIGVQPVLVDECVDKEKVSVQSCKPSLFSAISTLKNLMRMHARVFPSHAHECRSARCGCRTLFCVVVVSGHAPLIFVWYHTQVIIVSIVIGQELMKVVLAFCMIQLEFRGKAHVLLQQFRLAESLRLGAIPAAIYAVQNLLCQLGYRYLDFLSFNLLNQTKMLSTAAFVYVLMG